MTRARIAALAAVVALAACGKKEVTAPGVGFGHPASIAVFRGVAGTDPALRPYYAVANELRGDVTLVDATSNAAVLAPVKLRSLAVPVQYRPAMLVASPLGDGGADLLVAIGGDSIGSGDSSLQLVRTWDAYSQVEAETPVDGEVLDAVALPNAPGETGTARIALALSGSRVAIFGYRRSGDGLGIEVDPLAPPRYGAIANGTPIQPVALAAMPGDPASVYAATRDQVAAGVWGVAKIGVSGTPAFESAIDARGPTRLVAAATLRERLPGSVAADSTAFGGQAAGARVYAVLDESGCGPSERIDCGVVVLDPAAGTIRADVSGRMPYLAPIQLPSPARAIAISGPTEKAPTDQLPTADEAAKYSKIDGFMRLWPSGGPVTTTAVAGVACDNGLLYFLDLARWKLANSANAVVGASAAASLSAPSAAPGGGTVVLSVMKSDGTHVLNKDDQAVSGFNAVPDYVKVTPGYTADDTFSVDYQVPLQPFPRQPPLALRRAEAGLVAAGRPWLAMQVTGESGILQVVELSESLGVKAGDIVQIDAAGVPGCAGTESPGAAAGTKKIFEARVAALLPPDPVRYPGGALELGRETIVPVPAPPGDAVGAWGACFDALAAAAQGATVRDLTASLVAGEFVVTSVKLGYVGRPDAAAVPTAGAFSLEYPAIFDGTGKPVGENDASLTPERLMLARKARRFHHVAEDCEGAATEDARAACRARFPGLAFPDVAGPTVQFKVAIDAQGGAQPTPIRGMHLTVSTSSGVVPLDAPPAGTPSLGSVTHPNGIATFDRSSANANDGYRFVVPYPANFLIDTTPSLRNAPSAVIR